MFGEKVRKYGFWILDFLKKGEVRKHYKDITEIIEGKAYNSKIDRYLSNLLNYAVNNTDFYSEYRDYKSIKDFPIIDKNIIKANIEGLLSQEYRGKELHCMSTSGSTGTPLTIKQNKNKRNRVLAEIIYFGEKCDYFYRR
jgi:phenylacetate-CoA ligase